MEMERTNKKQQSVKYRHLPVTRKYGLSYHRNTYPEVAFQRVKNAPIAAIDHNDVMVLQRTIGNHAVGQLFQMKMDEHKALQLQQESKQEEEEIQAKRTSTLQFQTTVQKTNENSTGMPDSLKSGIESLSGVDMSDVRVHRDSDMPAKMGALAYTHGTDIYMAPKQEKHLPHEVWHAVQQKQGRVQPNAKVAGLSLNDDSALEREADVFGEKAQTIARTTKNIKENSATTEYTPFNHNFNRIPLYQRKCCSTPDSEPKKYGRQKFHFKRFLRLPQPPFPPRFCTKKTEVTIHVVSHWPAGTKNQPQTIDVNLLQGSKKTKKRIKVGTDKKTFKVGTCWDFTFRLDIPLSYYKSPKLTGYVWFT